MTSFLYERNRPRRPDEFVNHWKWELAAEKKAKELELGNLEDKEFGITFLDKSSLIRQISELLTIEGTNEREIEQLRDTINKLSNEKNKEQNERQEAEDILVKERLTLKGMTNSRDDLKSQILLFGDHTVECEWIDLVNSGRICEGKTEENTCDCGWYVVQKKE